MSDKSFAHGELVAALAAGIDASKHRFLSELRVLDLSGEWGRQGFRSCAQWMSWRLGWETHTSREYVRTAHALENLPAIDNALRLGKVSYSKVRAMTRVATPENEATLLDQAQLTTAGQLATICRKYATILRDGQYGPTAEDDSARRYVSRRERDDGMVVITAVLHADEAERVWTALDRVGAELCRKDTSKLHHAGARDQHADVVPVAVSSSNDPVPSVFDASVGDAAAHDASVGDAAAHDANVGDAAAHDASVGDAAAHDASVGDAAVLDASAGDATVHPSVSDAAVLDAPIDDAVVDAGVGDAAVLDATIGDVVVDSGGLDTIGVDAAVSDAVVGDAVAGDVLIDTVAGDTVRVDASVADTAGTSFAVTSIAVIDTAVIEVVADDAAVLDASVAQVSAQSAASPEQDLEAANRAYAEALAWSPRTDSSYWTPPASWYEEDEIDEPNYARIPISKFRTVPTAETRERQRHERRTRFDRANALVAMAEQVLRGSSETRSPTEVVVTISYDALVGAGPECVGVLASGTCVPAETVRRLCCDAGIVPMLERHEGCEGGERHMGDGDAGRALQVGRKSRAISAALMRALSKRDRTCTFPGCTTRVFLEGHHMKHWADGGATAIDNLCRMCSHHHRYVHEYGYSVSMLDGQPQFRDARGRDVRAVPSPPSFVAIPTMTERDESSPGEPWSGYDGTPVSYPDLIEMLIRADRL